MCFDQCIPQRILSLHYLMYTQLNSCQIQCYVYSTGSDVIDHVSVDDNPINDDMKENLYEQEQCL